MKTTEELKHVTGGTDNGEKVQYCKYCHSETLQFWNGTGPGWDRKGEIHMCNLWVCKKCNCTNYWDVVTGHLI